MLAPPDSQKSLCEAVSLLQRRYIKLPRTYHTALRISFRRICILVDSNILSFGCGQLDCAVVALERNSHDCLRIKPPKVRRFLRSTMSDCLAWLSAISP